MDLLISIVMENYRKFINPAYSVRQVLVEYQHFNELEKCDFIKRLLLEAPQDNNSLIKEVSRENAYILPKELFRNYLNSSLLFI